MQEICFNGIKWFWWCILRIKFLFCLKFGYLAQKAFYIYCNIILLHFWQINFRWNSFLVFHLFIFTLPSRYPPPQNRDIYSILKIETKCPYVAFKTKTCGVVCWTWYYLAKKLYDHLKAVLHIKSVIWNHTIQVQSCYLNLKPFVR